MPEEPKSPLDQLLDLVVYAPLGLAKTIADSMPELVAKGRKEFETQTTMARMMGQYAVKEAQKDARRRTRAVRRRLDGTAEGGGRGEPAPAAGRDGSGSEANGKAARPDRAQPGRAQPERARPDRARPGQPAPAGTPAGTSSGEPAAPAAATSEAAAAPAPQASPAPSSGHLAIPGYDTLSASQVVQRLAGLAPDELEAVRAYEDATRGRRTILSKIGQLQADRT